MDFRNFFYPTNWNKRPVHLKDGTYEHAEGAGGDTFEFVSVDFADVTSDGKQDAVVRLNQISCGVSCDGGSSLFYFYSIKGKRPSLVWRFESGSLAYECGLKSFVLDHNKLTVEVFRVCQYKGSSFQQSSDSDDESGKYSGGKFRPANFTRFVFEFRQGKVIQKVIQKARQTLPNPQDDVRNYHAAISIAGD